MKSSLENNISSVGANLLFGALATCNQIEEIEIESIQKNKPTSISRFTWFKTNNKIGPDGVVELAHLLETTTTLKKLAINSIFINTRTVHFIYLKIIKLGTRERGSSESH